MTRSARRGTRTSTNQGRHAARGGTLLGARFPRAYIDPNRAETDIDATLLAEPWPEPLAPQPYTQRGMGLIRRDALPGVPLYDRKLSLEAVRHRIDAYYLPYRRALAGIAEPLHARRAVAYRLPFDEVARQRDERRRGRMAAGRRRQRPARHDRGPGLHRVDRAVVRRRRLSRADQRPVPGGDLLTALADPARQRHSIQIEFNRALYMDEAAFAKHVGFATLKRSVDAYLDALADYVRARIAPQGDPA